MDGLAQQMAGPQAQAQQPMPQQGMAQEASQQGMPTVEQVVELLMQGADPKELVEKGVPPELIMQAIQIIEQQMAGQEQQQAPMQASDPGLAQNLAGY